MLSYILPDPRLDSYPHASTLYISFTREKGEMRINLGALALLVAIGLCSGCIPATWDQVCDRAARTCTLIKAVCYPFNSIIETLKPGSESHVSDLGYTIEVWPYSDCDSDTGTTFEECRTRASESFEGRFASWYFDPHTFVWEEEWPLQEIAHSNFVLRGYKARNANHSHIHIPYTLKFTQATALANAQTFDALCRVFWLTGTNVTIRDAHIDTTECCRTYTNGQTSAASCTPIVCSGPDCNSLKIHQAAFRGVSVAVRLQCDAGCITEANNVSISFTTLTPYNDTYPETPLALFAYDVAGSISVQAPTCISEVDELCPYVVLYKVATFDTTFNLTQVLGLNISSFMSPERALYNAPVYPSYSDVETHITGYQDSVVLLGTILGVLIGITVILSFIAKALRESRIADEEAKEE